MVVSLECTIDMADLPVCGASREIRLAAASLRPVSGRQWWKYS